MALRNERTASEWKRQAQIHEQDAVRLGALLGACRAVREVRERELLEDRGPCSNTNCYLHHHHSGPCDETQ
jgi:hypothetical protein